MHRGDLHDALLSALPAEIIHLGKKLVGLDQAAGHVTLTFADGSRAQADAVIGADGVHSVVRDIIIGPDAPVHKGRIAYRAVFPSALMNGRDIGPSRTKWWGLDRHIVIYYTNKARSELYFVTSVPEPADWLTRESWSAKGDVKELRQGLRRLSPGRARGAGRLPGLPQVGDPRTRAAFALERRPRRASRRCLPSDDALHGTGRGDGDRGRGRARPLPRRDGRRGHRGMRFDATRPIASRAPRSFRRSPAPIRG